MYYDISFLKDYIKQKSISQRKFAKYLNMSVQYCSLLLNGQKLANQNHIDILLDLFNVKTYNELKKLVENDKNNLIEKLNINAEDKRYDISFLNDYINNNRISKVKLSNYLNISYDTLRFYLEGKNKCDVSIINKLLEMFEVETYEELKNKINQLNVSDINLIKSYDISFLKDYFDNNNIKYIEFAHLINCNYQILLHFLSNVRRISVDNAILNKIYDCFEVKTYEELVEVVNKNIVPNKLKNISLTDDLSYLKEYLKLNKVSQRTFAYLLNINYTSFNSYVKGTRIISNQNLEKIYNYFGVKNVDELKDYCYINGIRKQELLELLMKSEILINIKNNLLKQYLYSLPINVNINVEDILQIVKEYTQDKYVDIITLLFNNNYSINEISLITETNPEDICKIFRDSIKLYIDNFYINCKLEDLKILKKN